MSTHPRIPEIISDPEILSGVPCFSGTRIAVSLVLDWMATGWDQAKVLKEYPQLTPDDISAGLRYASGRLTGTTVAAE